MILSSKSSPYSAIAATLVITLILIIDVINCKDTLNNPHVQKKLQQRLKHELHNKKYSGSLCDNQKSRNRKNQTNLFILTGHDESVLTSVKSYAPWLLDETCKNRSDIIEINWYFEFFESIHCIKVELDFGKNVSDFVNKLSYSHFGFSYRELGKPNEHLQRHPINESVNKLYIRNANLRPYIVCVTFYKSIGFPSIFSPMNSSLHEAYLNESSVYVPDCTEASGLYKRDDHTHDIDLCIDIDTQAHFLSDFSHDTHKHNSELIMVVFILLLITFMLVAMPIANSVINTKKRKHLQTKLRNYLHRKKHNDNGEELQELTDSKPTIIVTNYSSSSSLDQMSVSPSQRNLASSTRLEKLDEVSETVSLLSENDAKTDKLTPTAGPSILKTPKFTLQDPYTVASSGESSAAHTVRFHIGEAIAEEPEEPKNPVISDQGISHILDDKPWLTTSRSNSVVACSLTGANGSRSNFETDINSLSKRLVGFDGDNNNGTKTESHVTFSASSGSLSNETNKIK